MALIPELVELAARHGAADREKVDAALKDAARNQSSLMRALVSCPAKVADAATWQPYIGSD